MKLFFGTPGGIRTHRQTDLESAASAKLGYGGAAIERQTLRARTAFTFSFHLPQWTDVNGLPLDQWLRPESNRRPVAFQATALHV